MTEAFGWQSRVRLVDEVARVLRERIYNGVYPPGELLRQVQLSQELNVSRTPLREALRILQSEGLVEAEGARGVSVSRVDGSRLLDAYALREMLDGLAARQAAERSAARACAVLSPLLLRQLQALEPWEPNDYIRCNVAFHAAVIELAENEFLKAQLALVHMTASLFTPAELVNRKLARTAIDEHRRLAAAIVAGQGETAERLARAHIRAVLQSLAVRPAALPGVACAA